MPDPEVKPHHVVTGQEGCDESKGQQPVQNPHPRAPDLYPGSRVGVSAGGISDH